MDFQKLVDSMSAIACVISVERTETGRGTIRIVTGNRAYVDSIEHPPDGIEMLTRTFVPNSEYTRYFAQDLNFENYCYLSATKKKCLHSYVNPERFSTWLNLSFLPLAAEHEKLDYCLYVMEVDQEPDADRIPGASNALASKAIEAAFKLNSDRDFRAIMRDVIKDIRELCNAEHCCILLVDEENRNCSVLCEDFAKGSQLAPMASLLDEHSFETTQAWDKIIAGSNCLIVTSDHDKEVTRWRDPEWYDEFEETGVDSILLFPLKAIDKTVGYIWVLNFDTSNAIKIKETLEVTSFVLASQIANYLMVNQLRLLSSHDMLTGVQNRNELNMVIKAISNKMHKQSVGIVAADLNGLKSINDSDGHGAGDALLKEAAQTLLEVFEPEQVFRAGGDEFTIVMTDIAEEEFAKKESALRKAIASHEGISFAIGSCFQQHGADVRKAMQTADTRMYADKRAHYQRLPNDRRRGAMR